MERSLVKSIFSAQGDNCIAKKKEELVDLDLARGLSLEPVEDGEKPEEVIAKKLQLQEGLFPSRNTLQSDWTSDFSEFPNFTQGDMYTHYHQALKAYKSFEGYRLFWDGHVLKLMRNKNLNHGYHFVKFGVKPTTREKTQIGQKPTYDGWIIYQSDGSVFTAHCPCTGG